MALAAQKRTYNTLRTGRGHTQLVDTPVHRLTRYSLDDVVRKYCSIFCFLGYNHDFNRTAPLFRTMGGLGRCVDVNYYLWENEEFQNILRRSLTPGPASFLYIHDAALARAVGGNDRNALRDHLGKLAKRIRDHNETTQFNEVYQFSNTQDYTKLRVAGGVLRAAIARDLQRYFTSRALSLVDEYWKCNTGPTANGFWSAEQIYAAIEAAVAFYRFEVHSSCNDVLEELVPIYIDPENITYGTSPVQKPTTEIEEFEAALATIDLPSPTIADSHRRLTESAPAFLPSSLPPAGVVSMALVPSPETDPLALDPLIDGDAWQHWYPPPEGDPSSLEGFGHMALEDLWK